MTSLLSRYIRYTNYQSLFAKTLFMPTSRTLLTTRYILSKVRLIDEHGKNLGVILKDEANQIASTKSLNLVQVVAASQTVDMPVYKLIETERKPQAHVVDLKKLAKHKELTMKSQIDEQDLLVKAKKLQTFLDKGFTVTLKISKPRRGNIPPHDTYEKLVSKLTCEVKMQGNPKDSENYFRCVVLKKT